MPRLKEVSHSVSSDETEFIAKERGLTAIVALLGPRIEASVA